MQRTKHNSLDQVIQFSLSIHEGVASKQNGLTKFESKNVI